MSDSPRHPFDDLHQALIADELERIDWPGALVEREHSLPAQTLSADVAFILTRHDVVPRRVPSDSLLVDLTVADAARGGGGCLFEPFSARASLDAESRLVEKAQRWRQRQRDQAHKAQRRPPERPGHLWVLLPWFSQRVVERFGLVPSELVQAAGVYDSQDGFAMGFVFIDRLAPGPATLLLRLCGRGQILVAAYREVQSLPDDDPRRAQLMAQVARYGPAMAEAEALGLLDDQEEEILMNTQQWFEQQLRDSKLAGERAGIVRNSQRIAALRLGRDLTEREQSTIVTLVSAQREDELARVVLERDADGLADWLETRACDS